MMSDVDTALVELVLHQRASTNTPLRVLEWGSGISTVSFTEALRSRGTSYHWTTVEHDRRFFESAILPLLPTDRTEVRFMDTASRETRRGDGGTSPDLLAIVFERGILQPNSPFHEADRLADLDDYVMAPRALAVAFDVILVDGRKRRRCLIEAASLAGSRGIVLLHDAQRPHYHCAFGHYQSWRFVGDDLWIGANYPTTFDELGAAGHELWLDATGPTHVEYCGSHEPRGRRSATR